MITVWGRATSGNVQIVMWAIAELGLEHERLDVGGSFGGNNSPDYLAMNPNGLVPTIRDKGMILWESAAIVRYLGATYGDEQFWPKDPLNRAPLDQWAEWTKSSFQPTLLPNIFWPLVAGNPATRDEKALAAAVKRVGDLAAMIESRLGEGDYMGGSAPCFADIIFGTLLYRYFTLDFERRKTPNLEAYYARLTRRPAYAEHVMVSYEAMRWKP
ncbi:MAG: glutathione S-transferase family protein [Rhizobiaceae bacterium]